MYVFDFVGQIVQILDISDIRVNMFHHISRWKFT